MYIVLEYLLLENFIINYLVLYLTKILIRVEIKNIRLIIGSTIASLYSLVFFYPSLIFLVNPIAKFLFSLLIIRISFRYLNIKLFVKQLLGFYIISFIFAGATIGIFYSSTNMNSILNKKIDLLNGFPVKYLIVGIASSIIITKIVFNYFNLRVSRENYITDVTIRYKENDIKLKALLDTGNSLVDPFTNNRVLVVEFEILKCMLPYEIGDLIKANEEYNFKLVEEILLTLKDKISLNIIPFKSIGKTGILFTFKPDLIIINYMEKEIKRNDIIVGIYTGSLTKEMGYSGLMHYELINGGVENEYIKVQN